jgi:ABC-type lipopolysaccharide export system ATPase subunit
MPALQTFKPTPAVLPERTMGTLTDLNAIVKDMPTKTKKATEDAVKETQTKLEEMDRPGFEAREGRLGEREAGLERDSAISRALTGIKTGLRIAGSKERTLAGALGNEGSQGIEDLIRGEAANRAARDRLEDYRDSLEQQKVAAKKGNYSAAQTAGREASRDLQAATQLSLQGAQAGNAQAISMYSALQQGDIGKATVQNQGQQLQLSAVDLANRNALGIAQLQQQGSISKATLAAQEKRYASLDDANKARIMQATAKGLNDFMQNEGATLRAQLAKDYGPNFLTATDARSLEAQRIFNQRKQAYLADIRGQAIDALSARSADALLGQ